MVQRENSKVTVSLLNPKVNQGLRLLNTVERLSKTSLKSIHLRVWVCHGQKKIFFEFIVGLDRVAQDKLFGVGMTLLRPRVCPLETV